MPAAPVALSERRSCLQTWPQLLVPLSSAEQQCLSVTAAVLRQVVVEPSGAVGLAAVLSPAWASGSHTRGCQRVGVVLCGGNLDWGSKGFWEMWLPKQQDKDEN